MPVYQPPSLVPRLIAARVDFFGEHEPQRCYASIPHASGRLEDGFRDITYQMLALAIDKAAWWLDSVLSSTQTSVSPETFAYSGPNDLRYPVLAVAGIKTGRKILMLSPFCSSEGYLKLFDATACNTFICTAIPNQDSQFGQFRTKRPGLKQIIVPALEEWLNDEQVHKYEYSKTEESAMDDPIIIMHTSGTTGNPKPVVYTNRAVLYYDILGRLSSKSPRLIFSEWLGRRVWTHFPLLHLGGLATTLFLPLYLGSTSVLGPAGSSLSTELAQRVIEYGNVEGVFVAPSLVSEMARKPSALASLSKLRFLHHGGAVLGQADGDLISRCTRASIIYGATELMLSPLLALDPEDWAYVSFHPSACKRFTPHTDNLFELSIVHPVDTDQKDPFGMHAYPPIFSVFPHLNEYQTRDLWEPHPTKSGLWRWRSRTDDIIALSSGLKLDTIKMQLAVQDHPLINAAIIGGHGRPRSFLLLELNQDSAGLYTSDEERMQSIWTTVEAGNMVCAASAARVAQGFVVIASPGKPFARLPKGSVDKHKTFNLYGEEIEKLYDSPEAGRVSLTH